MPAAQHRHDNSWYLSPEKPPSKLTALQLKASATRLSTPERYSSYGSSAHNDSRLSTPGSKHSQATTGMREVGPDGSYYLRVGTQWVKQMIVQPDELDAIVARLSVQPKKDNKKQLEQSTAVKLMYDGYKESYKPVKRVSKEEHKQNLCALADRCQETRKATKAQLQQKYLQPVAKVKYYSKEQAKEMAARVQRLVEGLGAFEKNH